MHPSPLHMYCRYFTFLVLFHFRRVKLFANLGATINSCFVFLSGWVRLFTQCEKIYLLDVILGAYVIPCIQSLGINYIWITCITGRCLLHWYQSKTEILNSVNAVWSVSLQWMVKHGNSYFGHQCCVHREIGWKKAWCTLIFLSSWTYCCTCKCSLSLSDHYFCSD